MPPKDVAVLGIDAAWTDHEPSGMALVARRGGRWLALGVAPSAEAFGRQFSWAEPVAGGPMDIAAVLEASAELLNGIPLAVVAVDMPLATVPIRGRRTADQRVSEQFGHRGCSTHSPNTRRPGRTGEGLSRALATRGFALDTHGSCPRPALIEVYPHVALLGLMQCDHRLPYKVGKARKYWPGASVTERRRRLLRGWQQVLERLAETIGDMPLPLPPLSEEGSLASLKRYEDTLDALICAWVGVQYLEGRAVPLGDETAAIWVPSVSMRYAKEADAA